MDWNSVAQALMGGVLIGIAVTLMLLFNGRVTGISGILASSLAKPKADGLWRWFFLAGMILSGLTMHALRPELFTNASGRSTLLILFAGLLVGYGTVMGGGCTSGHGICGVSRLSARSIVATLTFMLFGFITVQIVQLFFGAAT